MRYIVGFILLFSLAACGSSRSSSSYRGPVAAPFATGPIYGACMNAGRSAASSRLCGCVQSVADRTLSTSDQSRAVSFFRDPQKAQDARGGSAFWTRYKAFS
ncbi:MAG: arginine transporter, partial [Planktomarina sp.]